MPQKYKLYFVCINKYGIGSTFSDKATYHISQLHFIYIFSDKATYHNSQLHFIYIFSYNCLWCKIEKIHAMHAFFSTCSHMYNKIKNKQ